jgi:LysM repeat protein
VIPVPAGKSRVVAASRAATRGTTKDRDHVRYRIQPGDTLSSIAEEHGTTIQKLKDWNGLTGTRISAGSVLRIYSDTAK